MLNSAILIKVKQRLNKLASNDYDNLESWQIIEAFDKAQVDWCRRNLHGLNIVKEGDEQSTRRIDDLQVLLTQLPLTMNNKQTYYETVNFPSNYLQWKRVSAGATSDCCPDPKPMVIYLAEAANVDELLRDVNKRPVTMALKGNLNEFSLTQLLNLISLANKTGTLIVEGKSEAAKVSFREGKLAYAQFGQEDNSLVGILHKSNRLSASQYQGIKEKTRGMGDKELGLLLINANYFSQQDIIQSLQSYFTEILNRLFTWMEGLFQFESNLFPPDDRIMVRVGLENIILEGMRKRKEWEYLQDEIPSLDLGMGHCTYWQEHFARDKDRGLRNQGND